MRNVYRISCLHQHFFHSPSAVTRIKTGTCTILGNWYLEFTLVGNGSKPPCFGYDQRTGLEGNSGEAADAFKGSGGYRSR